MTVCFKQMFRILGCFVFWFVVFVCLVVLLAMFLNLGLFGDCSFNLGWWVVYLRIFVGCLLIVVLTIVVSVFGFGFTYLLVNVCCVFLHLWLGFRVCRLFCVLLSLLLAYCLFGLDFVAFDCLLIFEFVA